MARLIKISVPSMSDTESEDSIWSLPLETESEIATLAAVCHSKQQQREVLRGVNGAQVEDWSDDELVDDDDNASTCAAVLTTDNTRWAKMNFLDRLAEILCTQKDASYVTCTSMLSHEDSVTLLAARNAEWTNADQELMKNAAEIMEQIATQTPLQNDRLLNLDTTLAEHYGARLHHHTNSFLELLKKHKVVANEAVFTDETLITDEATNETALTDVIRKCCCYQKDKISAPALVDCAAEAVGNKPFLEELRGSCSANAFKRMTDELRCISRPRRAINAICRAARDIDAFQNVKVVLLSGYPSKQVNGDAKYSPGPLDDSAMKYLVKVKWVHAEIRMITHLLSYNGFQHAFPYLGISKKTCLLCGHIIQCLGMFNTRSNHGKIYSQWTVPSKISRTNIDIGLWERAVERVRDVLRREAERRKLPYMQATKESTVTTPAAPQLNRADIFASQVDDFRLREREVTWLSAPRKLEMHKAEDDGEVLVYDQQALVDIHDPAMQVNSPPTSREFGDDVMCSYCHHRRESTVACSRCDVASYCDAQCRQKHWSEHKFHCRLGRPIDAADHLVRACHQGQYPTNDEEVGTVFGFRHFIKATDRLRLFELYCLLIRLGGVNDDELREAWKNDQLKRFILFRGSQIPSEIIGDTLRWLRSQAGFAANSVVDFYSCLMHSSRDVLDSRQFDELDSQIKKQAYVFYCQTRTGYITDVDEDNWLSLGFCTARTAEQRDLFRRYYAKLIESCTFGEFWRAMETSTMVELFNKYDFDLDGDDFQNFNTLMGTVGTWHQSVWELKRFTSLDEPEPMRSVFVDYGFRNCHNPHDRLNLRKTYSRYFARGLDEMELHKACIDGNLYPFLTSSLGGLPLRSQIFANPYPLERCDYMGLVAKKITICTEADQALICEKLQADGNNSVVWTIPDIYGNDMISFARDRVAKVTGHMRITRSRVRNHTFHSISCE